MNRRPEFTIRGNIMKMTTVDMTVTWDCDVIPAPRHVPARARRAAVPVAGAVAGERNPPWVHDSRADRDVVHAVDVMRTREPLL